MKLDEIGAIAGKHTFYTLLLCSYHLCANDFVNDFVNDFLNNFVDNELSDYIMVMVANQRSRYQMKDDLSLFLGKDTDDFVNWLHDSLKNMQLSVSAGLFT